MKQLFLLLFTTLFIATSAKNKSLTYKFNEGSFAAVEFLIESDQKSSIIKHWENYLKDTKGKINRKGNEVFLDNGVVALVSTQPVDVTTAFVKAKSGTILYSAIDMGAGSYLTPTDYPAQHAAYISYLESFKAYTLGELAKESLKESEKTLKKDQKKLNKLEKKERKLEKKLKKTNKKINKKIEQNQKKQSEFKEIIKEDQTEIKTIEKEIKD